MIDDAELAKLGNATRLVARKAARASQNLKDARALWRELKALRDAALRERAAAGDSAYRLAGVVGLTPQQTWNIVNGKNGNQR